jgi:putative transposase
LVYRQEGSKEVFLARAYAQDLETEQLSLDEAKASSRRIREAGKTVSNRSILAEVRDLRFAAALRYRDTFGTRKKSKKERHKEEQAQVRVQAKQDEPIELDEVEAAPIETEPEQEMAEIFDYEQLREDYGW